MTNNLRNLQKDLRAFAKRTKDFKYTDSALVTFLMTGIISITSNLFSKTADRNIENQKHQISTSIKSIHQKVKETRHENNRLLKNTNLELVQLMEQGDHVVKSPWSSWQYAINEFYADWHGTYKGNGTKNPDEQRKFERLHGKERYTQSYSNGKYGATDIELVETAEPLSEIVIEASIRPKNITKQPPRFNLPVISSPVLPTVNVSLSSPDPVTPPTPSINPETPVLPVVNANPFSDFSYHWRENGSNRTAAKSTNAGNDFFNLMQNYKNIDGGTFWTGVNKSGELADYSAAENVSDNKTSVTVGNGAIVKDNNGSVILDNVYNGKSKVTVAIDANGKKTAPGTGTKTPSRTLNALNFGFNRTYDTKVTVDNITVNAAGGTALYDDIVNYMFNPTPHPSTYVYKKYTGGSAIHTVGGELEIKNSTFNLYGKAAAVNMESWRSPKVDIQNSTINIKADNNTVFNLQGGTFYHDKVSATNPSNQSAGEGTRHAGSITGKVDINVPKTGNTIYAIGGYARGFKIMNDGKITLDGASNVVISDLGYVADSSKYMDKSITVGGNTYNAPVSTIVKNGNTVAAETAVKGTPTNISGVNVYYENYIPALILNTPVEQYGDNNVTMFFNTTRARNGNYAAPDTGIYQGEVKIKAKIGEYLDSNSSTVSQTLEGNTGDPKFVENNVAVFARSGQRPGIIPSTHLGANYFNDIDKIHNLEIGNFDIKFGKFSKNGVMFYSEAGTVMDVGNSSTTAYIGSKTTAFTDGINGNSTDEDNASSNTIIAYSKGKWDKTYHHLYNSASLPNTVAGKPSEINMYSALTMNSKEGIAYLAEDYGEVNVGTTGTPVNTTARQYKSIVAYAKDNGNITINGTVTAVDDYLTGTHSSKADKSFNNVAAYAYQSDAAATDSTNITINGTVTVNGIGALAKGTKTTVALNAADNVINTGSTGGLAAQEGGKVAFGGGTIVHKNNGTAVDSVTGAALTESDGSAKNDHKNVLPFYADDRTKGSTVTFTGPTDLKMSDGLLVYGNKNDYDAGTASAVAKYLGMNQITVNLEGDNVNLGVYEELNPTWDGNDATYLNTLKTVPKFNSINANGHKYKSTLTKGTLTVDTNVDLSNAADKFNDITMEREKVVINAGKTIVGNGRGLSMGSNLSSTSNTDTGYVNKGTVNIAGGTAVSGVAGINVAFGQILNDTAGKVTVDNGAGLYGTNGSELVNDGTITVTGSGAGMFGVSVGKKADGSNITYGNEKIAIVNNGAINVAGDNSVGLYANSNGSAAQNDVVVNNTKSLTLANNSVGIIVKGGNGGIVNVTGTGNDDIKVGNNGIGIYGEKSKITLNSDYGISTGENGVGIYTDGTSQVIGTGKTLNYKYNGSAGTGVGMLYDGASNANGVNIVLNNAGNTADGLVGVFAKGSGTFTNTGNITGTGTSGEIGIITENNDLNNSGTISLTGNPASLNNANVGIYAKTPNNIINTGNITAGNNSIGIYGYGINNNAAITAGNNGIGIFSQAGNVTLAGSVNVGNGEAVAVFTNGTGQTINSTADINIGDNSYGFVIKGNGTNAVINDANGVTAGNDTVFVYSSDNTGNIINYTNLTATGKNNYGLYTSGTTTNYGNIDFGASTGNVAIYAGEGYARNGDGITNPVITVSGTDKSNPADVYYGIGMAAGYENQKHGVIENFGTINVSKDNSIGMYASGKGSVAINRGDINLSGKKTTGMYLDNGAIGENYGTIRTVPNPANDGIIGVVATNKSIIKNYGHIIIDAPNSVGIYHKDGTIEAEGDIQVSGTDSQRTRTAELTDTSKGVRGITINAVPLAGKATVTRTGSIAPITSVDTITASPSVEQVKVGSTTLDIANYIQMPNVNLGGGSTELGMYVDTSGVNYTNPIEGLQYLTGLSKVNMIIGIEAAKYTNAKDIEIGPNIIKPYNDAILAVAAVHGSAVRWQTSSSSLTWIATPTQNPDQTIAKIYLSKIPYQSFAKEQNTYNFLDGLEQRYGAEGKDSREWQIFDKLNGIGKGETHIFAQAIDEMKGHQYANNQQRINATGNTLDKEFKYLRNEWRNPSKQNNKIKVFGARDEYNTDTAGIVNYKSNAYGIAYVHEDETVKLGHSSGWYAGAVTNRFKFKDLGKSREEQTMVKAGIFKMLSPSGDHNGALRWTFGGDVFAGVNNMKRKFWVVDDTFEAKSDYYSYGTALKTDLGYDIRMSERTHLRPYGALKMEYGKFSDIKENSGQIRLEVDSNDYFSVKPEVGMEFKYIQPLAVRTQLSVGITAAYENELGKQQNRNRARVRYTAADWYNLEREKEDRRGNGKFDLNIGIDNTRFGVTVNAGYDTKGENVRGGIGFRAIY